MTPIPPDHVSPFGRESSFALSIASAVHATGGAISRTRMFELIRKGEIDARKVGRRTVVLAQSLRDYIERQPSTKTGGVR